MLNWANQFSIFLYLDSNNYPDGNGHYEGLMGAGAVRNVYVTHPDPLAGLDADFQANKDWLFGHINYDLRTVLEPKLRSARRANLGWDMLHFFVPQAVCFINRDKTVLTIESFVDPEEVLTQIMATPPLIIAPLPQLDFQRRVAQNDYLNTIAQLRKHIYDGDCYEINYCCEAFCELAAIDPLQVFTALNELSPAPFAAYYKLNALHLMCASPERYIAKSGDQLTAQPIKGTAARGTDLVADELNAINLATDIKERAENIMIVDLVRNDLARCCKPGAVRVEELCKVYTFPQVHQLISTVSGNMNEGLPFTDALRYTFPMGSMTGAPKFRVMQLTEQYEASRRELYSGTVGYIDPSGNFDFNVVIRSLFYNAQTGYLNYLTGGAITYDSLPEKEWEETRLKAYALERIFKPQ